MTRKFTTENVTPQQIEAGLALNDQNIEFRAIANYKTVWFKNGHTHCFSELPHPIYLSLLNAFNSDKAAKSIINVYFPSAVSERDKVEIYTHFVYGDLDHTPDVINGVLQPSENYREKEDCISLAFNSKNIDYKGIPLKECQIKIIDAWAKGIPDKTIAADILNIATSTFDYHRTRLFKLFNVNDKAAAVAVAAKHHILCEL